MLNKIKGVKSWEQAEQIADIIGGTLLMLNGSTAIISGGDVNKLGEQK